MKPAIVVTGASSGIGRELAFLAAREAGAMVLIGLSQASLDDVASKLTANGVAAHVIELDLARHDAGRRVEEFLNERGLFCDILVNSAGFGVYGPAAEMDREQQIKLIDVNARALADLTLRFLPGMLERGRGGVLNIASITAYSAGPYMALYFASKAFVKSFTLAIATEVAGSGVAVTCLLPGVVRTAFFARCGMERTRLIKLVPRANAAAIAEIGWRGFKAGRCLVIPRLIDRIIVACCSLVPERALTRLVSVLNRPGTKNAPPKGGELRDQ
jgi:uncharacterized protein